MRLWCFHTLYSSHWLTHFLWVRSHFLQGQAGLVYFPGTFGSAPVTQSPYNLGFPVTRGPYILGDRVTWVHMNWGPCESVAPVTQEFLVRGTQG